MIWTLNIWGFRQGHFQSVQDVRAVFLIAALEEDGVSNNWNYHYHTGY